MNSSNNKTKSWEIHNVEIIIENRINTISKQFNFNGTTLLHNIKIENDYIAIKCLLAF